MSPHLLRHPCVRVRIFAYGEKPVLTGKTAAARDRKWNYNSVALLQVIHTTPHVHDFSHKFMAENVAALHRRNKAVVKVEIGAADRGRGDFNDGVSLIQNLRVGHLFHPHVLFANPTVGSHSYSFPRTK